MSKSYDLWIKYLNTTMPEHGYKAIEASDNPQQELGKAILDAIKHDGHYAFVIAGQLIELIERKYVECKEDGTLADDETADNMGALYALLNGFDMDDEKDQE